MLAVIEMVKIGGALPSDQAIGHLAALIDKLDISSPSYMDDLRVLVGIGATIWMLQSKSAHRRGAMGRSGSY